MTRDIPDYADWHSIGETDECSEAEEKVFELIQEPSIIGRRRIASALFDILAKTSPADVGIAQLVFDRTLLLFSAMLDEMPECPEKYGVAYAIGATFLVGRSMSEIAAKLGCTRAIISYRARAFCRRYNLPPSDYMRKEGITSIAA